MNKYLRVYLQAELAEWPAVVSGTAWGMGAQYLALATCKSPRWQRQNFAGRQVSLAGGVATAGALAGGHALRAAWQAGSGSMDKALESLAVSLAASAGGACGLVDDLDQGRSDGEQTAKGFKGHLRALARGHVSTGIIKILGIGGGAACAAAVIQGHSHRRWWDWPLDTALIAGMANLHNLLDLRPGRVLKFTTLIQELSYWTLPGSRSARAFSEAVSLSGLENDLKELTMLGDTGANAIGAAVGTQLAAHAPRPVRLGILAAVVALTAASEKISFSQVIARTPALRWLDNLGRKPA